MTRQALLAPLFALLACPLAARAQEPDLIPLTAVVHAHSSYSHGSRRSLDSLAGELRSKGVDVFITSDHIISSWEYGLWPLRRLLFRRVTQPSVLSLGVDRYLEEITRLRRSYPDLIVVPGVEVAAFYRWEGSPFSGLRIVDWNRHFLAVGLESARDYERMPVLGNSRGAPFRPALLLPLLALLMACCWIAAGWKKSGWLLAAAALLLTADGWPFRRFSWDPYAPQTPWAVYDNAMQYVLRRGGLCFWAHPDAPNWQIPRQVAPKVSVQTSPYPDALISTKHHNGFCALFEGNRTAAKPGMQWDQALLQFCRGQRAQPPWALAELDYSDSMKNPNALDSAQIRLWAKARTPAAVMEALRLGRFYIIGPALQPKLALERWELSAGGQTAASGQTLFSAAAPRLGITLTYADGSSGMIEIQVIRNGEVILGERVAAPFTKEFVDTARPAGPAFYRLYVRDHKGTLLFSNPIFVKTDAPVDNRS